jgi:segregation and condensation protein A
MFGVDLPSYHGPLDLLLYLIRREELPLEEISLSKITAQYTEYVSLLEGFDLDEVGEYIDIASQLIELKARFVLPSESQDDAEPNNAGVNPETMEHLVERLLQYKRFRDVASVLDEQSRQWQLRFPRLANDFPKRRIDSSATSIARIEVWDLVSAFGRILKAKQKPAEQTLAFDNTPLHVHMQRLHALVKDRRELELQDLFESGMHKSTLIAMFIATLELTRHYGMLAVQEGADQPLVLVPGPDFPDVLQVHEVDNTDSDRLQAANMPVPAR